MTTPITADHLQATIKILRTGLTSVPLSTVITGIDTWFRYLQDSGVPELQDMARELGNLQSLLTTDGTGIDGLAVGRSLTMLGAQAIQSAVHGGPEIQGGLSELGDLLIKAGSMVESHK